MGVTTLKRKARRNKGKVAKRNHTLKVQGFKPVIKMVDVDAIKEEFKNTKPKAKAEKETAPKVEESPKAKAGEKKETAPKAKKAEEAKITKEADTEVKAETKKAPAAKKTATKKTPAKKADKDEKKEA